MAEPAQAGQADGEQRHAGQADVGRAIAGAEAGGGATAGMTWPTGRRPRGGLLVAGTTSDAGKSVLTAGLCRWLARQGVSVAPFKAQNMSNNSAVCLDPATGRGAEIGRAQAMQAAAAGVVPDPRMNPVLLKPGSDRSSQVVLLGRPFADADALSYQDLKEELRGHVLEAYDSLRAEYEVVLCEGAGSPTEINLRRGDLANLGLARARDLATVVVGDIDRGGVFAAFHGTVALLEPADQELISGFIINRFRGDAALLEPALGMIAELSGRPTLGVLPYLHDLWIDAEDSLSLENAGPVEPAPAAPGTSPLSVTVVRLPRVSNFTDVDALRLEPGVEVSFTTTPRGIAEADLVVLPGTKSTVDDLRWLRERGIADALLARRAAGRPILGICGGYQMLGLRIEDEVESGAGEVDGLGLLPVRTRFARDKTLARPSGHALGAPISGTAYEIHHGLVEVLGGEPFITDLPDPADPAALALDGCADGPVLGTLWHGALESDAFRAALLDWIAPAAHGARPRSAVRFAAARQAQYDRLADAVDAHLDTAALLRLIEQGPTPGLALLPPGSLR